MTTESAMVLTHSEWFDLAWVCSHFLGATAWVDRPNTEDPEHVAALQRQRDLCQRIVASS